MKMNWNFLVHPEQLDLIDEQSQEKCVMIYKHSTRCHICTGVQDNFENKWNNKTSELIIPYILDLLGYRELSNQIEKKYKVRHQSPQVLIVRNGVCIFHRSQISIRPDEILSLVLNSGS